MSGFTSPSGGEIRGELVRRMVAATGKAKEALQDVLVWIDDYPPEKNLAPAEPKNELRCPMCGADLLLYPCRCAVVPGREIFPLTPP